MIKYYDRKLQEFANSEVVSDKEKAQVLRRSQKLLESYQAQLAKLRPRLGERNSKLLFAHPDPIFDSNLLNCSVGDRKLKGLDFQTEANVYLLDFDLEYIFSFHYSGVHAFQTELPKRRWITSEGNFGSLLWHEVKAASKHTLSHEFLFTSGATIALEFEELKWRRTPVRNAKSPMRGSVSFS